MSVPRVGEPFAAVLRASRVELNERFAQARHELPELDGDSFSAFLVSTVDPWVDATEAVAPDRVVAVARAGFEAGLQLVGHRLVGAGAARPEIEEGLQRLLAAAAQVAATAPERAVASLGNALHEVASTPGARMARWVETMEAMAGEVEDLDAYLAAGQIAAWRHGLSHYRDGALELVRSLPPDLAARALDAPSVDEALSGNRWTVPGRAHAPFRVVHRLGAFRGFGGPFLEVPRLEAAPDAAVPGWIVRAGEEAWLLVADGCGATLHRARPEETEAAIPGKLPRELSLRDGVLSVEGRELGLPIRGDIVSASVWNGAVAISFETSFAILVVALGEP